MYEGEAWLGFGFSESGQMVGSTVVIGLPDEPNEEGTNPGRFYLADKSVSAIQPVKGGISEQQAVLGTSEAPSESPTTPALTQKPSSTPSVIPTVSSQPSAQPTSSFHPSVSIFPTAGPTHIPTAAPQPRPTPTQSPTNWWCWRRELRSITDHDMAQKHRTLIIEQAAIQQNETHTVLQFSRPLQENGQMWEGSFRTFLYAVGSSNEFGYHLIRGTGSMDLTVQTCAENSHADKNHESSPNEPSGSGNRLSSFSLKSVIVATMLHLGLILPN